MSGRRGAEALIVGERSKIPRPLLWLRSGLVRWGLLGLAVVCLLPPWHLVGLAIISFLLATVGFALDGATRRLD